MSNLLRLARELADRRVVREGGWIAASQALSALARLAGLRVLTELLAPGTYAEVVLLVGLATLGGNVLCYPILESTLRFYPEAAREGRVATLRAMLSSMLGWRTAIVAVAFLVVGLGWKVAGRPSSEAMAFAMLAAFFALDQRRAFEQSMLNASRRQATWALWNTFDVWARPLAAAAAILLLGTGAGSALLGFAVAVGLGNLAFRRSTLRPSAHDEARDAESWRWETRAQIARYSTPLIPLAVLGWVMTLSDRYLVAGLVSAEEAGIYAAAYGLASQPFTTAADALSRTLRPIFNDAVARRDVGRERQVLGLWLGAVAAVLLGGFGLMVWLADWLVTLVLDDAFRSAVRFVPWIAAAYVIQGMQQVFEAIIYAQRRTRRFLVVWAIASATALGLYLLWIPEFGAMGAAMGTLVAMGTSFVTTLALADVLPRLLRGHSLGRPDTDD